MNKLNANNIWFNNLTSLRFFAAALVVLVHIEQARDVFGLNNFWKFKPVYSLGDKAVTLFFVLSGFLITYLLLQEKMQTNTISIKQFYVRRILRIWPLYYLIVFLALFILPNIGFFYWPQWSEYLPTNFFHKCLLFIFFLPNVNQVIYPAIPFGNQLWSIGVEEQFYLFWPILVKYFKNTFMVLFLIVIGMPILIMVLYYLGNHENHMPQTFLPTINFLKRFLSLTRIDCMAVGGLAAYVLFKKMTLIINVVFSKATQVFNFLLILLVLGTGAYIPFINNIVHGVLFSILILNLAANPNSIFNIEHRYLKYLGKISYGIYMFHPLCIFISIKFLAAIHVNLNNVFVWVSLYIFTFCLTIFIAGLSFKYFESFFLNIKNKFSPITTPVTT